MFFLPGLLLWIPPVDSLRDFTGQYSSLPLALLVLGIASAPQLATSFHRTVLWISMDLEANRPTRTVGATDIRSLSASDEPVTDRPRLAMLALLVLASFGVFLRGLNFEILPTMSDAHALGPRGLVDATRAMASESGLVAGTRIALIGQYNMDQPLPLPILGVLGNAAILSDLETAHLYEPMEPAGLMKDHLGLTLPWRVYIHDTSFYSAPSEIMAALRSIGVQAALSDNPAALSIRGTMEYKDRLGRVTYVLPVKNALPGRFPDRRLRPHTTHGGRSFARERRRRAASIDLIAQDSVDRTTQRDMDRDPHRTCTPLGTWHDRADSGEHLADPPPQSQHRDTPAWGTRSHRASATRRSVMICPGACRCDRPPYMSYGAPEAEHGRLTHRLPMIRLPPCACHAHSGNSPIPGQSSASPLA